MSSSKPSIVETRASALSRSGSADHPDKAVFILLGLAFALHFLVKGWLNVALVAIWLVCVVRLALDHCPVGAVLRDRDLHWLLAALTAPFAAV
ncbi:MAG TPA: hypothetical protein VKP68_03150, partial [Ramlibacter sp.]|nr:hypothetical protein [Ramlibacter sp.]